jgi:glycosyltransferase involved in cell wall biosynthesis
MTSSAGRTSVIVAARNAERTLGETLDSLIGQTDPDWNAWVVDDGSTDATADIIAAYARRDARISLLRSTGEGVSAARNIGLARAEGKGCSSSTATTGSICASLNG